MGGFKQQLIAEQIEVGDRKRALKPGRIKPPIVMTQTSYLWTVIIYVSTGVLVGLGIGVML